MHAHIFNCFIQSEIIYVAYNYKSGISSPISIVLYQFDLQTNMYMFITYIAHSIYCPYN